MPKPAAFGSRVITVGFLSLVMGLDSNLYVSWLYGVPWLILISAAYFIWKLRHPAVAPAAIS